MGIEGSSDNLFGGARETFVDQARGAAVYDLAARRARVELEQRNAELESRNKDLERKVRQLQQLAYIDELTGLANRRCFEVVLRAEIRRACRANAPLALAICDVDYFKRFNDELGHRTGDAVLKLLGRVLRRHCRRAGDLASRYGGEEFALLWPGTPFRDAVQLAERLRGTIERLAVPHAGRVHGGITISIGLTTFQSRTPCRSSTLVKAADAALYGAKRGGRNRLLYRSP